METIAKWWVILLLVIGGTVVTGMLVMMALDMAREIIGDWVYIIRNRGGKK